MYNREKGYRVTLIKTDVSNDLQVKPKNNYDLTACTRFFAETVFLHTTHTTVYASWEFSRVEWHI